MWSFGNYIIRNIVIFGVDISFLSKADNRKNNFLVLVEVLAADINDRVVSAVERFSINWNKDKIVCIFFNCNFDNSYLFVNGLEIYKFKVNNKNHNFPTQFYLGSMSNEVDAVKSREISFNRSVHNCSVDYNVVDKTDILNIQKYLMVKKDIK